jgi:hypothetical protein
MDTIPVYILISIITLGIIAFFVFRFNAGSSSKRLSPLAALAFISVIAGLYFSEKQFLGYWLLGIGILLAIADIIVKSQKNHGTK